MEPAENRIRKIVLQRLGTCRVCHRQHQGSDVSVLSQKPDVWMMVVECPDCQTRSFVAAVVDEKYAPDAESALKQLAVEHHGLMAIDQAPADEARNQSPPDPVTDEDVSEMHEFLQTFNGDFRSLFAKG